MNIQLQPGDLLAVRGDSFLSKAIRYFMRKKKGKIGDFSHIAVVINLWDEIWIAEALTWGVRIWSLAQSGYDIDKQYIILRDKRGFTPDQIQTLSRQMVMLSGIRYQYFNFLQWIVKIILKINIFIKPSNQNAIYCSELGSIAINSVYPGTFPEPNITSPSDIVTNPNFEIIDTNNILSD
jgi:hypothetical protein